VTVSRESDAVTSSTCRTNPPSNETIDVFYIKKVVSVFATLVSCLRLQAMANVNLIFTKSHRKKASGREGVGSRSGNTEEDRKWTPTLPNHH